MLTKKSLKNGVFSLVIFLLLSSCANSPTLNNTYGTKITGQSNEVKIALHAEYPYLSNINGLKLRVGYRAKGVAVSEVVSGDSLKNGTAKFTLPTELNAVPEGNICMQIEPQPAIRTKQGLISVLPVIRDQSATGGSVKFQYPEWSADVKRNTSIKAKENEIHRLQSVFNQYAQNNNPSRAQLDCDKISVDAIEVETPKVTDRAKFDEAARRVCVHRAVSHLYLKILDKDKKYIDPHHLFGYEKGSDSFVAEIKEEALETAGVNKVKVFKQDWKALSPIVKMPSYRVEAGEQDDYLGLTNLENIPTDKKPLNIKEKLSNVRTVSKSLVSLYDICVSDVKVQLGKKLDSFESRKKNQSQEDEQYKQYMINDCKSGSKSKQDKETAIKQLELDIQNRKMELESLRKTLQPVLPAAQKELNYLSCEY